jgi:hypothetical protein
VGELPSQDSQSLADARNRIEFAINGKLKENREEQERARGVLSAQMNAHVCCVTGTERIFKQGGQGEVGMGEDKTLPCKVPPLPSLPLCSALLTTLNAPPLLCFPLLLYPSLSLSFVCLFVQYSSLYLSLSAFN